MTVAILSWAAHETLLNTLESYAKFNLADDERIIYFQEISSKDKEIAHRYGYQWLGSDTNIGIAGAYAELVKHATGEFFLFLENDWELIRKPRAELDAAKVLLHGRLADVVRLRHRIHPGAPLWTVQFKDREMDRPTHLLDSVHWSDPAQKFPALVRKYGVALRTGLDENIQEIFWHTDAQHANWTNNPTMFRTEWLRETIVPKLGTRDVELDLQPWWEHQDFRVAQGEGLFTHKRLDR